MSYEIYTRLQEWDMNSDSSTDLTDLPYPLFVDNECQFKAEIWEESDQFGSRLYFYKAYYGGELFALKRVDVFADDETVVERYEEIVTWSQMRETVISMDCFFGLSHSTAQTVAFLRERSAPKDFN